MLFFFIMLSVAVLLVFLGCLIRFKKAYWLISGYNTMSEEEQNQINKDQMGKYTSDFLFVMAGCILLSGLFFCFHLSVPGIFAILLVFPLTICFLVLLQKRVYINKDRLHSHKGLIIGLSVFLGIVMVGVFVLLFFSNEPNTYTVQADSLVISGMYGETVHFSDLKDVEIKNSLPGHLWKSSGSGINTMLKGNFKSDMGMVKLFVDTSKPPYIYLNTGSEPIILNTESASETQSLYEKLKAATY